MYAAEERNAVAVEHKREHHVERLERV